MLPVAMTRMMTPQPYQLIDYRQASPASIVKNTRIANPVRNPRRSIMELSLARVLLPFSETLVELPSRRVLVPRALLTERGVLDTLVA